MAFKSKVFFGIFIISSAFVCFLSFVFVNHIITGDAPSYLESMTVMGGGGTPAGFVPNRILTSSLAIGSVGLFSGVFGSVEVGWAVLNIFLFFVAGIVFYKLISDIFADESVALVAALFFITNYAMVVFALDYGVDIGGWVFYLLSLYFTLKYVRTGEKRALLFSALCIGVGGLFKEYALLATIPIAVVLGYENWRNPLVALKEGVFPALIALAPLGIVHVWVYLKFNYTYMDWLSYGSESYTYSSELVEYIKSFGSLYNVLAPLVIVGVYCFFRYQEELLVDKKTQIFIVSVVLSVLPVFIWPAITQRILFITMPAAILVASFAIKKYKKYSIVFLVLLAMYATISFTMDSIILPYVNIGPILSSIFGN